MRHRASRRPWPGLWAVTAIMVLGAGRAEALLLRSTICWLRPMLGLVYAPENGEHSHIATTFTVACIHAPPILLCPYHFVILEVQASVPRGVYDKFRIDSLVPPVLTRISKGRDRGTKRAMDDKRTIQDPWHTVPVL